MPKRNAQARIEHYTRKIKKIEEKERLRARPTLLESSSGDEGSEGHVEGEVSQSFVAPEVQLTDQVLVSEVTPDPGVDPALEPEETPSDDPILEPDLLDALGESISETPDYGPKIHDTLSKLWLPLLKKGMPNDDKGKLLKDYLIPDNCRLLQAPTLNAEISAAVPDIVQNRDKKLTNLQRQLGCGITAINRGIDMLLKGDDKTGAIKHPSNGCRLLCDSHYASTQNRVKLVTPSLDKSLLHMITDGERDETLFGSKLSEKIKTAKVIEKQGLQIKKPYKPQNSTAPHFNARPSTSQQGNWTAPPRYPANRGGGRGGFRQIHAPATGARRPFLTPGQRVSRAGPQDKYRAQAPASHH